jgi:hypothetical protein
MTDFLTIDGVPYGVLANGADQPEPDDIGEEKRAIDGTLRSNVQGAKRNFRFTLEPMDNATYLVLETKAYGGNFYVCGGVALPAALTCRVRIVDAGYEDLETTFRRTVQVSLRQQ